MMKVRTPAIVAYRFQYNMVVPRIIYLNGFDFKPKFLTKHLQASPMPFFQAAPAEQPHAYNLHNTYVPEIYIQSAPNN